MIVIDASAMIEALVGQAPAPELLDGLARDLTAPHLLDVEVVSVLRGLVLGGRLTAATAARARCDYFAFTVERRELEPLADRVWALRHQFTAYDASYLALAEALGCPLYTCDAKLAGTGHRAEVRLMERTR